MTQIKEIIEWMIEIENLAFELYSKSEEYFKDDHVLRKFLAKAAEDEAFHSHVIESTAKHLDDINLPEVTIILDEETKSRVEEPFRKNLKLLDTGKLSKDGLFECMIKTELSEWNDLVIYVVNLFKHSIKEFRIFAASIQNHKRKFEKFFESTYSGVKDIKKLRNLSPVWKEKILIVDDEESLTELLKAFLSDEAEVHTAENGVEALEKLNSEYYKVIISDINMPVMDGMDFYENALRIHPDIDNKFIFYTGNTSGKFKSFAKENNLQYFTKPVSITDLRNAVHKVLFRS